MDSMNRMRAFHKKMDDPGTVPHPVSGEQMEMGEHERSLSEIFGDPQEQNKFVNKFLFEKDPVMAQDIADSLADDHVLTDKQEKWMESQRKAYNLRSFEVEQVRESLDDESMEHLASLDPRIRVIVGKVGAEKAAEFLGNEFGQLAFADSKAFKRMSGTMQRLRDVRTRPSTLALEREFRSQLFQYRISEEDYFRATKDAGSTLVTEDKLAEVVASQYGYFKKALDFVSAGGLSHYAGRQLLNTFEEQKRVMGEADKHMKAVGKVLQLTLNQDTKLALQKFMVEGGVLADKKEKQTINTISDYRRVRESIDPADMQKRFDSFLASEARKRKKSANYAPFKDEMKELFSNQEFRRQQQNQKATGLFAILMAMLFQTKDQIKSSLK